jgi:preprotein translocase subunit SecD
LRDAIAFVGTALCVVALVACGGNGDDGAEAPEFAIYDWEANLLEPTPFPDREEAEAVAEDNDGSFVIEAASESYVIRDEPAVTAADVASAEAVISRATGEPAVDVTLTPEGEDAFADLTRGVAERTDELREVQHFAIVVNGAVLSLPIIDTEQNPKGISAREGLSVEGGLTEAEAEELATKLDGE